MTASNVIGAEQSAAGAPTLLGTWQLVRWDITYGDGRPASLPFGPDATGLVLYSGDGNMSVCIARGDGADALTQATGDARTCGGLTAFLYSTDGDYISRAERAYAHAGAQLKTNLTGAMPLNFAAAYSDYHMTGLNPAGNAALTSLAFVASRFCIAQSRRPVSAATTRNPGTKEAFHE